MIFKRFYKHIKHIFPDFPQRLTWLDTPVCWDQGSLLPQEVRPRNHKPHHGHCVPAPIGADYLNRTVMSYHYYCWALGYSSDQEFDPVLRTVCDEVKTLNQIQYIYSI